MKDKILIVDDDDGHAELIAYNLRESGINNQLVHYSSGFDVLDAITECTDTSDLPVLILLDLNMPGMHGTKVLKELRNNDLTSNLPVIILTTSANSSEINECYELGCNLYLNKPVQYDDFIPVLQLFGHILKIAKLPSFAQGNKD